MATFAGEARKDEEERKYRSIEATSNFSIMVSPRDKWLNPLGKLEFKRHTYKENNGDLIMEGGGMIRLSLGVTSVDSGEPVDFKDYEIKFKFQKLSGFVVLFSP